MCVGGGGGGAAMVGALELGLSACLSGWLNWFNAESSPWTEMSRGWVGITRPHLTVHCHQQSDT